jgi:uncharacterized protein YfaS (alpha-2-macroglobulin family)
MPKSFRKGVADYLAGQLRKAKYSADIQAYIVYSLAVAGVKEPSYAARLYDRRGQLSVFGKSFLLLAIKKLDGKAGHVRKLAEEIQEKFTDDGSLKEKGSRNYYYFSSELQSQASALMALLEGGTKADMTYTLAQRIINNRKNGYWYTTQRTMYALMALAAYARRMKPQQGAMKFEVTLDGKPVSAARLKKVTDNVYRYRFDFAAVVKNKKSILRIKRLGGAAPLFYTLRARYAERPTGKKSTVVSKNIALYKRIETLDGKSLNGRTIPAGKLVRIRVFAYLHKKINYLAINDPLPAGLEAVNTALSTSPKHGGGIGDIIKAKGRRSLTYHVMRTRPFISHREFRDDRVVFFADKIWSGFWEFTYLARATTRGRFTIPPATAEAMYDPKYMARSELLKTVVR